MTETMLELHSVDPLALGKFPQGGWNRDLVSTVRITEIFLEQFLPRSSSIDVPGSGDMVLDSCFQIQEMESRTE